MLRTHVEVAPSCRSEMRRRPPCCIHMLSRHRHAARRRCEGRCHAANPCSGGPVEPLSNVGRMPPCYEPMLRWPHHAACKRCGGYRHAANPCCSGLVEPLADVVEDAAIPRTHVAKAASCRSVTLRRMSQRFELMLWRCCCATKRCVGGCQKRALQHASCCGGAMQHRAQPSLIALVAKRWSSGFCKKASQHMPCFKFCNMRQVARGVATRVMLQEEPRR